MTFIDPKTFEKIVELLVPHMIDSNTRQAFVIQALYASEELSKQIDFSGSAKSFTVLLVRKCIDFGEIHAGDLAVIALLNELHKHVGEPSQTQISELIAYIKNLRLDTRNRPLNHHLPTRPPRRAPKAGFYEWNRLWYKRSSNTLTKESGNELLSFFLGVPSFKQHDMFHLEELEHIPCLILLGEPGLGKTESLRSECLQIADTYGDDCAMFVDLEPVDTTAYIRHAIFNQPKYERWKTGDNHLYLFLDSLDRAQLGRNETVATIVNELRSADVDISRLTLRIACRDLDWSFEISDSLKDLWQSKASEQSKPKPQTRLTQKGDYSAEESHFYEPPSGKIILNTDNCVQIYQLAPLTHSDIILAAKANKIDANEFVKTVLEHEVFILAQIPILLNFLLKLYKDTLNIGNSRHEVYYKGCLKLCEKYPASSNKELTSDVESRFRIAQRVMATLVLGNKSSVTYEHLNITSPSAQIHVSDIIKPFDRNDEQLVKEALSTGLFKDIDPRTFFHRSIAEYMTAEYLVHSGCSTDEIKKILKVTQGQFAQQLIEVVRWLIEIGDQSLSNEIANIQPVLFLNMDLSAIDNATFLSVLEKLLNINDEYQYIDLMKYIKRQRKPIPNSELSDLVRPYLEKSSHSDYKRRFVVELIGTFSLPDLDDDLVNIVFDVEDDYVLRHLSAGAIYDSGTSQSKQKLKPFIYGVASDPDDELKGYALLSLWPDFLSAEELFGVLYRPKRESYAGSYALFLNEERILQPLATEDLPIALRWVSEQPRDHNQRFRFRGLTYKIMQLGWDNFHLPIVQKAFAFAALARITHNNPIFSSNDRWLPNEEHIPDYNKRLLSETNNRHQLVILLSQEIISQKLDSEVLLYGRNQLLTVDDFEWVIEQLENSSNDENKFWSNILYSVFEHSKFTIERVKRLRSLSSRHANLYDLAQELLQDPDDAQVVKRKEQESERIRERFEREISVPEPHDPPPMERVEACLLKIESGDYSQWMQLVFDMLLETPNSHYIWDDTYPDIMLFPGWNEASEETRLRIINAAKQYLSNQEEVVNKYNENGEHWLSTSSVPWVEIMGYLALFLLAKTQFDYVSELTPGIWHRWADAIVWYPAISGYQTDRKELDQFNQQLQYWLVKQMFDGARIRALSALKLLIKKEDHASSYIYGLRKFEHAWNEQLETFLMQELETELAPKSKASILEFMLRQDSERAIDWAENLVRDNYTSDKNQDIVIRAIVRLMKYAPKADWAILWNAMTFSDEIGVPVTEKVADWDDLGTKFLTWLDESQIADFYIWLERKYPSSEDPEIDGFHTVSTRESIGRWRNSIHTYLRNRKTVKATEEIERIAQEFPDVAWLQYTRVEAQRGLAEIAWKPSSPQEVINLRCKPDNE